jgi:hypothetical protein
VQDCHQLLFTYFTIFIGVVLGKIAWEPDTHFWFR